MNFGFNFGIGNGQNMQQNPFGTFLNAFMNPQQRAPREEPNVRPIFSKKESRNKNKTFNQDKPTVKEEPNPNTGLYWKIKGNEAYEKGDLETAVYHYTKAIELNSSESIFFSNRGRCLRKLKMQEEALRDAQEAVELDATNYKGHLLCGQILAEQGRDSNNLRKVENAITRFTKALTLSTKYPPALQLEISGYLYKAKKLLWYLQFNQVREARIRLLNEYSAYVKADTTLPEGEAERRLKEMIEATDDKVSFDIPNYLMCPITFELMEDPVTTDSGQTYERSALDQHFKHNGKTDPFTRKPVNGAFYPSVAIRQAVTDFLERNPWGYEYVAGETIKDITF